MRRFTKGTRWGAGVASLALIAATLTAGGGALAANADESANPNTPNAQSGAENTNNNTDPQIDTNNTNTSNSTGEDTGSGGGGVSPLAGEIPGLDVSIKITSAGSDTCIDPETPADDASCNQIAPDGMSATVPVNDEVVFEVQVVNNHEDMSDAAITLVLPKGMYMTSIPGSCDATGSSLTPTDPFANVTWPITQTVNEDQVQQQTLVCALPKDGSGIAVATGFSGGYFFPAKLGNLVPNNHAYDLEEVTFGGTTTSSTSVDVTLENLPEITAASMLKWNLSKNGTAATANSALVQNMRVPCPWDASAVCEYRGFPVNISAPPGGLGAMPVVGSAATWTDDLSPRVVFPGLTEAQYQQIEANPGKYAARIKPNNIFYFQQPESRIGVSGSTSVNAVIRSGEFTTLTGPAGTSAVGDFAPSITLNGTNWSLNTYPTNSFNPNVALASITDDKGNSGVPAYAVSLMMGMYIPLDTIKTFGNFSGGSYALAIRNTFKDFHVEGFEDADGVTAEQDGNYSLPNWLYRGQNLAAALPGGFGKSFIGVPGTEGNLSPQTFSSGDGIVQGPPGGATKNSGNIVVSPGQKIISGLIFGGPKLGDAAMSSLGCDAWDNTQLQLMAADVPAAANPGGLGPGGGMMQAFGSEGLAVWMSGYYNGFGVGSGHAGVNPDVKRPEYKVQYASSPVVPNNVQSPKCGDVVDGVAVTWYDDPADVPGQAAFTADGGTVYPAVNRVRVWVDLPQTIANASNFTRAQMAILMRVAPDLNTVGEKIPNWAAVAFNHAADTNGLSFEATVAGVNSGSIAMYSAALPANSNNTASGYFDRLNVALAQVRVSKDAALETTPGVAPTSWSAKADDGTNGSYVWWRLKPTLTNVAPEAGYADVVVEDCLPSQLDFVSASVQPSFSSQSTTGGAPSYPADAELVCGAGETYLQWRFNSLKVNEAIDPILVRTSVSPLVVTRTDFTNHVAVSSPVDPSVFSLRQGSASGSVSPIAAVLVDKKLLTPLTQVNRTDNGDAQVYQTMRWVNTMVNATRNPLAGAQMIDVLPTADSVSSSDSVDGSGSVALGSWSGELEFSSADTTFAGAGVASTIYATGAGAVNPNPDAATNGAGGSTTWCEYQGSGTGLSVADLADPVSVYSGAGSLADCPTSATEVTGLRWVSDDTLDTAQSIQALVEMTGVDNAIGDIYPSYLAGNAVGLQFPVGPIEREVVVIGSTVGDYAWWNLARDGSQVSAGPAWNYPARGVEVHLSGTDDLGNPLDLVTTTNDEGLYVFDPLRESDGSGYTVTFTKPVGASAFTLQNQEFIPGTDTDDDPLEIHVPDRSAVDADGVVTKVVPASFDELDMDAGLIAEGSFQFVKDYQGAGASLPIGDELTFEVSCQFPTAASLATQDTASYVWEDLDGFPQTFEHTIGSGESSWESPVMEDLPVGSRCSVVESEAGSASLGADDVSVVIGWDDETQSGQMVVAGLTNTYSAGKLELTKKLDGDPEAVEAAKNLEFMFNVTCLVDNPAYTPNPNPGEGEEPGEGEGEEPGLGEPEFLEVFSGLQSVMGGDTVTVQDADGDVTLPIGAKCFAVEVDTQGAQDSSVDYDSVDNAIEVTEGDPGDLETISITATNTFLNPADFSIVKDYVGQTGLNDQYEGTVTYTITVTNGGSLPGSYDLGDEFQFGGKITPGEVAVTGPDGVEINPTFDGVSDTSISSGVELAGGGTHVYTVVVATRVDPTITVSEAKCSTSTTSVGGGYLNEATLSVDDTTLTDKACGDIKTPSEGGLAVTGGPLSALLALMVLTLTAGLIAYKKQNHNKH